MQKKVIVVGNHASKKTPTIYGLGGQPYVTHPTLGVEITTFVGQSGTIYTIWDCSGHERYGGLRDGYYTLADIAIVFGGGEEIDCKGHPTGYKKMEEWVIDIRRVVPNNPIHHVTNPTISALLAILV